MAPWIGTDGYAFETRAYPDTRHPQDGSCDCDDAFPASVSPYCPIFGWF